ncbi:hypothetical protein B1222_17005 [Paenibacillus larvae subsp. pulvifaciens]|nr:hypothetical protein B1222_17005 [Paenibacillus larvae subsp. pulvifaciens]AQZ47690.1 hypothetical protein B5S25_15005 [Paenibacillus larvae subsp. pulvifaciens]
MCKIKSPEGLRTILIKGNMWYNGTSNSGLRGRSASPRKGGDAMETFQALQLMFLFGMFILALLTFI